MVRTNACAVLRELGVKGKRNSYIWVSGVGCRSQITFALADRLRFYFWLWLSQPLHPYYWLSQPYIQTFDVYCWLLHLQNYFSCASRAEEARRVHVLQYFGAVSHLCIAPGTVWTIIMHMAPLFASTRGATGKFDDFTPKKKPKIYEILPNFWLLLLAKSTIHPNCWLYFWLSQPYIQFGYFYFLSVLLTSAS